MHTQRCRADLLVLLDRHGEAKLDALALAIGYEPLTNIVPSMPKQKVDSQTNSSDKVLVRHSPVSKPTGQVPDESSLVAPSEVSDLTSASIITKSIKESTSLARNCRVVYRRTFEDDNAVNQAPAWYTQAKAFNLADDSELSADPKRRSPPLAPLMPWSRLWPFLKLALGIWRSSLSPDISRIVECLSREGWLSKLPRTYHRTWTGECQLIVDFAETLLPFWSDFGQLRRRITAIHGRFGLIIYAFPDGDPSGKCQQWDGKIWQEKPYQLPSPTTPTLILSDLGCNDIAESRRQPWRRFGEQMHRSGCKPVALMPCPPRFWDERLAKLFLLVCWDNKPRPPNHLGASARNASRGMRPAEDQDAEKLLALLSPAIRIEPGLLRAVRHLVGSDVGSEAVAWNHNKVRTNLLAFRYLPEVLEHYRKSFMLLYDALRGQLAEQIARQHAHLSPSILHEERLNLADLGVLSESEVADSCRFIQRLVKTYLTKGGELAEDIENYGRHMMARQMLVKDTWQREERVALCVAVHARHLEAGENLELPTGFDLRQAGWLLGLGEKPMRQNYWIHQRGDNLWLETGPSQDDSLLTNIEAATYLHVQPRGGACSLVINLTDKPTPIAIPLSLSANPRFIVRSDRMELEIDSLPPVWASATGRDDFGLWADFVCFGVEQVLRWIPPGEFTMGTPVKEAVCFGDEKQRRVRLTEGFWMADTPCTQALWQAVMGNNPSRFKGDERPVETVSWDDAQTFINRLNGLLEGGSFRLPTEAEWEYACRAGTISAYWFGGNITPQQVNYGGKLYSGETVDVKALPCNSWGLYQMHGNIWEWCVDGYWYAEKLIFQQQLIGYKVEDEYDEVIDPVSPYRGTGRILRGGSWRFYGIDSRSASRTRNMPDYRFGDVGFRIVQQSQTGDSLCVFDDWWILQMNSIIG